MEQDIEEVDFPHDDDLVISVQLAHAMVDRVMMDNGNIVNILQLLVIQKMRLDNTIKRQKEVLTRFSGFTSIVIGTIVLDVCTPPIVSP